MFVCLLVEGHYIKKWILPGMSVIVAVKTNFQSLRGKKWPLPFPETFELANEVWWISVVLQMYGVMRGVLRVELFLSGK